VQIDAPFHDHHAQARSRDLADILAAVKGFKQTGMIFHRDADPGVADFKDRISTLSSN
jgi:hypothetical protein